MLPQPRMPEVAFYHVGFVNQADGFERSGKPGLRLQALLAGLLRTTCK